jgi:hypothetical protein
MHGHGPVPALVLRSPDHVSGSIPVIFSWESGIIIMSGIEEWSGLREIIYTPAWG